MKNTSKNQRMPHYPSGYTQNRIMKILQKRKEIRFTDLLNELGISDPVLCHHLKILLSENKIKSEKRGRENFYSISNP